MSIIFKMDQLVQMLLKVGNRLGRLQRLLAKSHKPHSTAIGYLMWSEMVNLKRGRITKEAKRGEPSMRLLC
jgi:hypothetical protein